MELVFGSVRARPTCRLDGEADSSGPLDRERGREKERGTALSLKQWREERGAAAPEGSQHGRRCGSKPAWPLQARHEGSNQEGPWCGWVGREDSDGAYRGRQEEATTIELEDDGGDLSLKRLDEDEGVAKGEEEPGSLVVVMDREKEDGWRRKARTEVHETAAVAW